MITPFDRSRHRGAEPDRPGHRSEDRLLARLRGAEATDHDLRNVAAAQDRVWQRLIEEHPTLGQPARQSPQLTMIGSGLHGSASGRSPLPISRRAPGGWRAALDIASVAVLVIGLLLGARGIGIMPNGGNPNPLMTQSAAAASPTQPLAVTAPGTAGAATPAATPDATPGSTSDVPAEIAVTIQPDEADWPAVCSSSNAVDTVVRFITALNEADEEELRALIPERSAPLGSTRELGIFLGLLMPLESGESVKAPDVEWVIAYANRLAGSGRAIVLDRLMLSPAPVRLGTSPMGSGEPDRVIIGLTFLGQIDGPGAAPVLFSGKAEIECGDAVAAITVWGAAQLPDGAQRP